jgi:hypothetical protein
MRRYIRKVRELFKGLGIKRKKKDAADRHRETEEGGRMVAVSVEEADQLMIGDFEDDLD